MPVNRKAPPMLPPSASEAEILRLLDELHGLPEDPLDTRRKAKERELLTVLWPHLHAMLKPFLIHKFGAPVAEGGAAQFTTMLSRFFADLIDKRPDAVWRARSAREIRKWTSIVLSNLIRDYLKRENRYETKGEGIADLVEERGTKLKEKGVVLRVKLLDLLDDWCESKDPTRRLRGWILRHRYIDAMTRAEIAEQLGVTEHVVRKEHDAALLKLRAILSPDADLDESF